jgi:hypothetical protein
MVFKTLSKIINPSKNIWYFQGKVMGKYIFIIYLIHTNVNMSR